MFEEVIILYSCTENGAVLKKKTRKKCFTKARTRNTTELYESGIHLTFFAGFLPPFSNCFSLIDRSCSNMTTSCRLLLCLFAFTTFIKTLICMQLAEKQKSIEQNSVDFNSFRVINSSQNYFNHNLQTLNAKLIYEIYFCQLENDSQLLLVARE